MPMLLVLLLAANEPDWGFCFDTEPFVVSDHCRFGPPQRHREAHMTVLESMLQNHVPHLRPPCLSGPLRLLEQIHGTDVGTNHGHIVEGVRW